MNRAYSLLTVKSIDEDLRVIEGIATTPATDRTGDIVEPKGAIFDLPIPLLWQHDSERPIGHVTAAKVTDKGITVTCQFAKTDEPGALKDRLDEAWQSVKMGLVRGLSIGFKSVEEARINETWSYRFIKWLWLELSAVTLPANAEATITAVKSADREQRGAVSGKRAVVDLNSPGASGSSITPKGAPKMTTLELIAKFEAKRAADTARRAEIQKAAADAGRNKSEAEKEEFDNLSAEIKAIDDELVDLRLMAEEEKKAPAKVEGGDPESGARARSKVDVKGNFVTVQPNVEKGVRMARAAIALVRANGNRHEAAAMVRENKRWMDQTPDIEMYLKTAVPAGDTTTSGWASQLAYATDMESEFVELLRPMTILGKLSGLRRVPFNIRYGTQTAGATGNWVGQGLPIPVSKPTVSSGSLGIAKASALVAIDEELAKLSSPSAEIFVRDDMLKTLSTFLDVQFVDPNVAAVSNVNPAAITNGITAVAATGTAAANLRTDLATLLTNLSRNNYDLSGVTLIMTPETALNISLMLSSLGTPIYPSISATGGTLLGLPVITSNSANIPGSPASGRMIIAVSSGDVLMADEGQMQIDLSREAAIQLLDNPTNASTGSTVATSMVSMFQTHSVAIRCTRWINWALRRSDAVEYIKEAAYVA